MGRQQIVGQQTPKESSIFSPFKSFYLKCHITDDIKNEDQRNVITIVGVRSAFLSKYDENVHNFHIKDVERIKNDDLFIRRFIDGATFNDKDAKIDDVINLIIDVLSWRLEYKINEMCPKDFPIEFMKCGIIRQSYLDNGDLLISIVGRRYKKVDGVMVKAILPGILWYHEVSVVPYLEKNPNAKVHILFDATNCGLDQADTALIYHGVPILVKYYPGIIFKCYVHNLNWMLKPFCNIFKSFIPERFRNIGYMTTDANISDVIGANNVPDFMGGPSATTELDTFDGMTDIETVGVSLGFRRSSIEKFKKIVADAFLIK